MRIRCSPPKVLSILENSRSEKEPVWDSKWRMWGTTLLTPRTTAFLNAGGLELGQLLFEHHQVYSLPGDPAMAKVTSKVPSARTKRVPGEQDQVTKRSTCPRDPPSPRKPPTLANSEQMVGPAPGRGENFTKSQRRLEKSYQVRGYQQPGPSPLLGH